MLTVREGVCSARGDGRQQRCPSMSEIYYDSVGSAQLLGNRLSPFVDIHILFSSLPVSAKNIRDH